MYRCVREGKHRSIRLNPDVLDEATTMTMAMVKLDPNDGGVENIYPKISIEPGVENVYTKIFLYENYIYNITERKVRGVGRPYSPLL
ncbi:hypothetical protein Hanom_Chr08g00735621 [Helianthus anomalus]